MISVKICGITSLRDAELAMEAGARALGFIFYAKSPRAITSSVAREIARRVPREIRKVGVFVNQTADVIEEIADEAGLDMIQLSGDERPEDAHFRSPRRVVKAFRSRETREIDAIPAWKNVIHAVMIDSGDPSPHAAAQHGAHGLHGAHAMNATPPHGVFMEPASERRYGGTGVLADFTAARNAKMHGKPIILAGGLDARTAVDALRSVEPNAIDVCSGVESQPGKKDPRKLKLLFEALRRYEDELIHKHSTSGGIFRLPGFSAPSPDFATPPKPLEPPASGPADLLDEMPGSSS